MKKIALAFSGMFLFGLTACNDNAASKISEESATASTSENGVATEDVGNQQQPEFSFESESHDFGKIEEGTVAETDFVFTNTGEAPLIISNASGSCGCTVPEWPREPIAPGETGKIHVRFDSSNKPGQQTKQVKLNANTTPNTKVLTISAQVVPAASGEGAPQS